MEGDSIVSIPSAPLSLEELHRSWFRSPRTYRIKDPVFRAGHNISRIHFTVEKEGDSNKPTVLSGGLGYRDPIKVNALHRFTEILMDNNIVVEGLYNIRLVVSLDELNIDRIESISFNQCHHDRLGALEVYTKYELYELKDQLAASGSGMVVLGLHRQYCVEEDFEPRSFVMEIRTTTRPFPLNTPGYIKIYYMELDVTRYETEVDHIDGAVFNLHRPFIWSVDVGIKEDTLNQHTPAVRHARKAPAVSGRIIYYAMSGDGNYACTLSTRGKVLQLDMWDLGSYTTCITNTQATEYQDTKCSCIACKAPFTKKPCGQRQIPIDKTLDSDIFFDDRDEDLENEPSPLQIAISYDASRIVLMDAEKKYLHDAPFQVFEFWEDGAELEDCDDYFGLDLIRPHLRHFSGYGKFHFTSTSRDLKDELFITCDGMNVDIFAVDRVYEWEHIRRITLAGEWEHSIPTPRRLIEGLSGKYFHFLARNEIQMVGDLETGKLLHIMVGEGTGSLSSDGSMMLIHQYPNIITTRWTGSGTILGRTDVSVGNLYSSGPAFIRDDNYVLIPISKPDDIYGKGRLGMVLDAPTLSVPERTSYTSRHYEQLPQVAGDRGQFLYCSHGSRLDMVRLQDILVAPYPQSKYLCDDECLEVSADLGGPGVRWESEGEVKEIVIIDDLTIIVGFEEVAMQYAIIVSLINSQGESREAVQIPPLTIGGIATNYGMHMDKEKLQLFVVCDLFAMVWKLPTTFEGNVTLQSCLWTRLFYYKDKAEDVEVVETIVYPTILKVCNHGRIIVTSRDEWRKPARPDDGSIKAGKAGPSLPVVEVTGPADETAKPEVGSSKPEAEPKTSNAPSGSRQKKKKVKRPDRSKGRPIQAKIKPARIKDESKEKVKEKYRIPAPQSTTFPFYSDGSFSRDPFRFFNGLLALMHMFHAGKDPVRQAIMQYVGLYINRAVECNGHKQTILCTICRGVRESNYALTDTFLKAIFNSPHVRWVPQPNQERYLNPISVLLRQSMEPLRAINLAQIVINYCIRMSNEEKDPHFSLPVLDSLHELLQLRAERLPDIVANILRRLAYCPVQARSFTIDHAIVAAPPSLRWLFGDLEIQKIYAFKDPVFKLDRSLFFREHDPVNDNVDRDLFVVSCNMLWRSPELEEDERSPLERVTDYGPMPSPSWIRVAFHFFLCKLRIRPQRRVEFFDLPLEALDNPAIAALIEFKWNTIGYKYWLVRFFWQFIFYVLVLVAVLMQVYDPTQGYSLKGVFIAIIVMGAIFLVLELRQLFSSPRRYITSPYNVVDLLAFGLPLAGSIIQVINIENDYTSGNISTLSFAVLFIFLHILFELRVNQNVCHFVAIIVRIIGKIQVFFLIFAAGIIAFSIAILHMIRGCPVGVCDTTDIKFPYPFHRAISTTFFFMGGIWGPVEDKLEDDSSWTIHFMIMLYFFFTTILLLNVLIALMNVAFTDGDMSWKLIWRESRLQCIEGAEMASYNIPDYRETHEDIFPEMIYYFGTRKEQKEYREKYFDKDVDDNDDTNRDGGHVTGAESDKLARPNTLSKYGSGSSSSAAVAARESSMMELKSIKQNQEVLRQELKQELKQSQYHMKGEFEKMTLQSQEAQAQAQAELRALKEQLAEMKGLLATFLKPEP